jgi:RNA 2',3'-cyclic 3'-phosphodiesterase
MRLFFAVALQESAAEQVFALQRRLRSSDADSGLRWVPREQLHYTIKFLGEVDASRIRDCESAGREAAERASPFDLALQGLGGFPGSRSPRVIWLGASTGAAQLPSLAAGLDEALAQRGFAPEPRPFTPHLTLARVKGPAAERLASRLVTGTPTAIVATTRVSTMLLMQSHLSPQGARYSVVASLELAHGES